MNKLKKAGVKHGPMRDVETGYMELCIKCLCPLIYGKPFKEISTGLMCHRCL